MHHISKQQDNYKHENSLLYMALNKLYCVTHLFIHIIATNKHKITEKIQTMKGEGIIRSKRETNFAPHQSNIKVGPGSYDLRCDSLTPKFLAR